MAKTADMTKQPPFSLVPSAPVPLEINYPGGFRDDVPLDARTLKYFSLPVRPYTLNPTMEQINCFIDDRYKHWETASDCPVTSILRYPASMKIAYVEALSSMHPFRAAKVSGLPMVYIRELRKENLLFDMAVMDALAERVANAEEELIKRAVQGDEQEVLTKDGVATLNVKSDKLLHVYMQAKHSDYRQRSEVKNETVLQVKRAPAEMSDAELYAIVEGSGALVERSRS